MVSHISGIDINIFMANNFYANNPSSITRLSSIGWRKDAEEGTRIKTYQSSILSYFFILAKIFYELSIFS